MTRTIAWRSEADPGPETVAAATLTATAAWAVASVAAVTISAGGGDPRIVRLKNTRVLTLSGPCGGGHPDEAADEGNAIKRTIVPVTFQANDDAVV